MAKVTFFPLGNADSTLLDLQNGKKILFDFGDQKDRDDPDDKRIDLSQALRDDLRAAKRGYYDVFAVSHLDLDHVQRSSEFFWFDHAKKYQGEGRIKINELWVPAAAICEDRPDEDDARIIQAEARHRFKEKRGIRVFSEPCRLAEWCERNGISLKDRLHLITNAGDVVPGFTPGTDGVEFFAHSPFAHRTERGEELDRNDDALIIHATFTESGVETRLMLGADSTWPVWVEIVNLSKKYGNEDRLMWDIFKLPHHCSYLSLGPEKGKETTKPVPKVAWLYEEMGQPHGIVVSTSKPIVDEESTCPPHFQAANYHKDTARNRPGSFIVTMEHPNKHAPEPLVIRIDGFGATVDKTRKSSVVIVTTSPAPRAG